MATLDLTDNPFRVFTPEDMEAADVAELFVNPFTDFNKINGRGHVMLNGPRGCGKSMIFRYLLPDCQCIALDVPLSELPFLSFLVSIKNTGPTPGLTEFRGLENRHANIVLNEHVLTIFVAAKVFAALARTELPTDDSSATDSKRYFEDEFAAKLAMCGGVAPSLGAQMTPEIIFRHIAGICGDYYNEVVQYARRFVTTGSLRYTGALCGYLDFLLPLLVGLKGLSFLPSVPIYILIDDADYLNSTQTAVLNSWVSTRTQADVSIKISTQLRYKTLGTISGLPIQSPHDYQEINVSDIYTTRHGRYLSRVEQIVSKRLKVAGIQQAPRDFFPCDEKQEAAIRAIAQRMRADWPTRGRGHRPHDDSLRYARPEFIRSLGGQAKSLHTYSYSGFEQLVHISSGLVRYFLESATLMFADQQSGGGGPIEKIDPSIQDKTMRDLADKFMLSEFEIMQSQQVDYGATAAHLDDNHKQMSELNNLIRALGGIFFLKLVSDDSERRVFSVAISGPEDPSVVRVFELGVRCGYFHRSSIGNKDGTGRTKLYVLTRRLAPFFRLDPSSFAGYLWVSSELLREAMVDGERLVGRLKRHGVSDLGVSQLTLFGDRQ